MFDTLRQAESKRRREERKKAKTILLQSGCSLTDLTNESAINEVINKTKTKKYRGKQIKKLPENIDENCPSTSNHVPSMLPDFNNIITDLNQMITTTGMINDTKIKKNRRKQRSKKLLDDFDDACPSTSNQIPAVLPKADFTDINNIITDLNKLIIHSSSSKQITKNDGKLTSKKKNLAKTFIKTEYFNSKFCSKSNMPIKNKNNAIEKKSQKIETEKASEENQFGKYLSLEEVENGLKTGKLLKGFIRINPKDFKLSYISNPIKTQQDILIISIKDRNGALEGDKVAVKLKPESEWKNVAQKTARVVYILEKIHPRTTIGFLKLMDDKNKRVALFHPRDSRVPRMKVPFTDWPVQFYDLAEQYEKVLFLGKITKWTEAKFAMGTIIENIGLSGDIKSETRAILAENCLDITPYKEEMLQYFPATDDIPEAEYKYRLDLRKECIFTIDPLTARDLDDALSCKVLPNGNYEIGVHIADVTFYLKEATPLDEIVCRKATSIYMVESVYHMLPKELCMLCSLLPGEDKLAFSVLWEMTPEGKVLSHKFSRSVINSCVQLAYEHAQMMINNPSKVFKRNELPLIHNGYKPEDINRIVNNLQKLAVILRESRFKGGALRIDQPKVQFSLDLNTCLPTSYSLYENKESHRLVEEFMLLANITVATRIRNDYPDIAFLRSHPAPHGYMMLQLQATLEKVGIHLDVSSAGSLQQSMWKYSGDDELNHARMMVINLLCAKPMIRAHYFCASGSNDTEDYWHYALNIPLYTHFTSPIRRYADIMVHRQLAASLDYREKPEWPEEYICDVAVNCNKQKYNAKRAGEQSLELYLIQYIGQNQPLCEKAVVMDVKNNSFDTIVISNGLNVRIYLSNLDPDVKYTFLTDEEDNGKILKSKEDDKKPITIVVQWPEKDGKLSKNQIIGIFSIVNVVLTKKENCFKLETNLARPDVAY